MPFTVTEAQLLLLRPSESEVIPVIAGAAVTRGDAVYFGTADGKIQKTLSGTPATAQGRGIVLESAGSGQATSIVKRGWLGGYTLTNVPYDAQVFLDNAAGGIGTAAGTVSVPVGRVAALTDASRTKAVYVEFDWTIQRS